MHLVIHPAAEEEIDGLPANEVDAMYRALEKLAIFGTQLGYPHSSAVRGSRGLRELRPRAGRSAWRALYARSGEHVVVLAISPEAMSDRRRFDRAVRAAERRLAALGGGGR